MKTILSLLFLLNISTAFSSEYLVEENLWLVLGDKDGNYANISLPVIINSLSDIKNQKQKAEISGLIFHHQAIVDVNISAHSLEGMKIAVKYEACTKKYSNSTHSDFYPGFKDNKTENNKISLGSLEFDHDLKVSQVSFYYTIDGANRTWMMLDCGRD